MRDGARRLLPVGLFFACLTGTAWCADVPAGREYKGDFVLNREIPVNLVAGMPEHPRLVEVSWVRVEPIYGNAWALTARIGWSPVADATWSIRVELLDEKGGILKHPRDGSTTFTGRADGSNQDAMHYAQLALASLQWEMRKHAAKIRVILEPAKAPAGPALDESAYHRLVVRAVDAKSGAPIPDAVAIATGIHRGTQDRSYTFLCRTDAQGECRVAFEKEGLSVARVIVQKQGYANLHKAWSASYSWPIRDVPVADLPERHVAEMTPAETLGGVVQDEAGRPVAHAQVRVEARLEGAGGTAGISRSVQADGEGRWRVEGIPAEASSFSLGFKHPEYIGDAWANRRVTGEQLPALRELRHVATMAKGLAVSGRVRDDQSRPVPRAAVVLAPAYSQGFRYEYADTLTDASGQFRFGCSRNDATDTTDGGGSTGVLVEVPDYLPQLQRVVVEPNLAPLEFRLKRGHLVTVQVVDENKQPVPGAWTAVNLLSEDPRYGLWHEDTDERGQFVIPHAPEQDVQVTVGKSGYITIRDQTLSASEARPLVTMKLSPRVTGSVLDARTGKPVSAFELVPTFPDSARRPANNSCSFRDGRFELTFDEAPPESMELKVLAVGYKPKTSESIPLQGTRVVAFKLEADSSFDARALQRERGGPPSFEPLVITGTVVDPNGRPVPDVAISVRPLPVPETVTDAEGKFKLRGPSGMASRRMSPGRTEVPYVLARDRQHNLAVAVEFDLADAEDLAIKLVPGMVLSGKVTDEQGKGIPGAKISLVFWTAQIGYGMPEEAATPDPNGRYEIRAVPAGYRYSVNATAGGYGQNYVDARTAEATGTRMELEPIVLRLANLDISGIVVDTEDKPVARANVLLLGRGQSYQRIQADAQGRFLLHGVCAGPAQIQANTQGEARLYGRVETEGGAKDVKIVVSPMGTSGRYVPAKPPSLLGKPLPALTDLGIEPPADPAKDQLILLCFFDMNQRPSRNCLSQVAKRIEELRQKGVTVLAVQAGEADRNALDQWLQGQSIMIPVGSVQGDAKKATFAWGVQSLPWLVLTDAQHAVKAEGFPLNELDGKVEAVRKEP